MKKRIPGSLEDALDIIKGALGADATAETIGRSASLIYKMSDPDNPAEPNLSQAIKLDMACYERAEQTPILDFYTEQLEAVRDNSIQQSDAQSLSHCMMGITASLGKISDRLLEFTHADSEGGADLSFNEFCILMQKYQCLMHQASSLGRVLKQSAPEGTNELAAAI